MYNTNIKAEVINNVIFRMSQYVDRTTLDILQKILEEQLVAVNMEEITTLPAELKVSYEEQNRYYIGLMMIKKKKLRQDTKNQNRDCCKYGALNTLESYGEVCISVLFIHGSLPAYSIVSQFLSD